MLSTLCSMLFVVIMNTLNNAVNSRFQSNTLTSPRITSPSPHLLNPSEEVTTGGSVYLDGVEGPTNSPTGGSRFLFTVPVVGTDLALSALRLSCGGPLGDKPLLFRRSLD